MPANASILDRQLARVRRRLFLGALLAALAWAQVAALALAAGWFLVEPFLLTAPPPWFRWAVAGGLAGTASAVALVRAVLRAPSAVDSALLLDRRFGLQERVTTSLMLPPDQAATPAGQALLADAQQRVAPLRIRDRFPVGLPWQPAALVPAGVLALVLLAFFWRPHTGARPNNGPDAEPTSLAARADIDRKFAQLARRPVRKPGEKLASEDLERIQNDLERFTRKPRDTREDVRERIKDATNLEDEIRRRQKAQAERIDAFQQQMKQFDRLKKKAPDKPRDGLARKLRQAVEQADFEGAQDEARCLQRKLEEQDEAERLRRKRSEKLSKEERKKLEERLRRIPDRRLTRKEREKLQRDLKDLQDRLERLSCKKEDLARELKEMARRGELDSEQLKRELEQLEKNADKLDRQELDELARSLGECRKCLKEGQDGAAAKKLAKAGQKFGRMGKDAEAQQLAAKLDEVCQVKRALARALGGGVGAGRRPEQKEDTRAQDTRVRGWVGRGRLEVVGDAPGGEFKGPRKPSEMREEIRQAAQEAPAAIDRQRLPQSARKMARGYFERVRGSEKDKKSKP
jgi:hypothetical protein